MDLFLAHFFNEVSGLVFYDFIVFILAKYLPYFILFLLVLALWKLATGGERLMVSFILALAAIFSRGFIVELIRFFYDRPRPDIILEISPLIESANSSFPSGHASFFFALSFVLIFASFFSNRYDSLRVWGWWIFSLSILNSVARVASGTHWASDVLGGVIVGIVSALLALEVLRKAMTNMELSTKSY